MGFILNSTIRTYVSLVTLLARFMMYNIWNFNSALIYLYDKFAFGVRFQPIWMYGEFEIISNVEKL